MSTSQGHSRSFRFPPRLIACALAVLFVAFIPGCDAMISLQSGAATPSSSPLDVLHRNIEASNAEDLVLYMSTIHPQAPGYAETETTLRQLNATYDLSYSITDLRLESQSDQEARVFGVLTTRKISGPAFRNNRIDAIFVLRVYQGEWKIAGQEIINIAYE